MSRIRKAIKATLVMQMFNILSMVLSLVTVPLYLQWLGQERYGLLLTGMALGSYLMFADAGLNWASMLLIAEANGRNDRPGIASIVRGSFSLTICSAGLVMVLVASGYLAMSSPVKWSWLPTHAEFPGLLLAMGVSVVLTLVFSPFYNVLIGLQEAHLASAYQGAGRLIGTLGAVAVAWSGASLGWVFAGNVAGALIAALFAVFHCCRRHPWAFHSGSFWEASQIRQQIRTGAKSFAMQAGNILSGTAPVLAINAMAGPQWVPGYSISNTLLGAPLGILTSFSASLQAGYGEAVGGGEYAWIAETVRRLLRQSLVALGVLGSGFILLAGPFIRLWTVGHLEPQPAMLASVLAIAGAGAVLSVVRFALTGINRHRRAAFGDLACGILTMTLASVCVWRLGADSVGLGVLVATLLTSGWILPRELSIALGHRPVLPEMRFWICWSASVAVTFLAGWLCLMSVSGLPPWLQIILTGSSCVAVYFGCAWMWLRDDLGFLIRLMPAFLRRRLDVKRGSGSAA